MRQLLATSRRSGFTLVEMLVSIAILAIILAVLAEANSALSTAVTQTTGQVRAFQQSRDAFEAMTRRISQATLNSYNDVPATGSTSLTITGYAPASELRFICGPASLAAGAALNGTSGALLPTTPGYHPTHAIFFQAPLGVYTGNANSPGAANLVQMLNTCGYYIEWNVDTTAGLGIVPTFIPASYTPRYRFRLMEMVEPSDNLSIYNYTSGANSTNNASKSWSYSGQEWYTKPFATASYQHVVADNVILLAFLPMVAPQSAQNPLGGAPDGTSLDLAPDYLYDSSPPSGGVPPASMNRLPPMIFVEMIAVDENSFSTYQARRGNSAAVPTDLGIDPGQSLLTDATYATRQTEIQNVTTALQKAHISYRVYTTIVPLTAH